MANKARASCAFALLLALLFALDPTSHADQNSTEGTNPDSDQAEALAAWIDARAVILMRHTLAPGGGDPVGHDLSDCSTQRNLSEPGRAQALPAVLVTHQVNISALTGRGATSGEFVVVTIEDDTLKVLASVDTPVP